MSLQQLVAYTPPGQPATLVRTGGSSEGTHESRFLDSLLSHFFLPLSHHLSTDTSLRPLSIPIAIATLLPRSLLWSLSLSRLL